MKILWRLSIQEDHPELLATSFSGKFGDDISSIEDAESRFKLIKCINYDIIISNGNITRRNPFSLR